MMRVLKPPGCALRAWLILLLLAGSASAIDVEPPPSRLSAVSQPSATIRSAVCDIVVPGL